MARTKDLETPETIFIKKKARLIREINALKGKWEDEAGLEFERLLLNYIDDMDIKRAYYRFIARTGSS